MANRAKTFCRLAVVGLVYINVCGISFTKHPEMNLVSCDGCGVVLDKDKLPFAKDIWDEEGESIDSDKAVWDGDTWTAFVKCPVCGEEILK